MRLSLQLRHAREIADYWADNGLPMEKKPVTASLEDFASGKVRVRDMVKIKGVDEEAQTRA